MILQMIESWFNFNALLVFSCAVRDNAKKPEFTGWTDGGMELAR
jgi:hypothetical protein